MRKLSVWKWSLFLFVLILTPSLTMAQSTYIGSKKCMTCHSPIYEMWKDTLHNNSQQGLRGMGLETALPSQDWEQPLYPPLSMEPGYLSMGSLQPPELVQGRW